MIKFKIPKNTNTYCYLTYSRLISTLSARKQKRPTIKLLRIKGKTKLMPHLLLMSIPVQIPINTQESQPSLKNILMHKNNISQLQASNNWHMSKQQPKYKLTKKPMNSNTGLNKLSRVLTTSSRSLRNASIRKKHMYKNQSVSSSQN